MKNSFPVLMCTASASLLMLCVMNGCSGESVDDMPVVEPSQPIPIKLDCSLYAIADSRATDTGFEAGDQVGLYVVNHKADGTSGTLAVQGNHVDNMRFTYDGSWTPDTPIYWQDDTTKADFYLYYPYGTPTSTEAYPFSVAADQSASAAYKASDFLWGKRTAVSPSEQAVTISAAHVMSCARVRVEPGNGFTEAGLDEADVTVSLNGVKTEASIDLSDGTATATGVASAIKLLDDGTSYKALLPPQTVEERDNLVTVTIDGRDFNMSGGLTFEGGRRYTITATVSKTSNGINVNITPWEDDDTDYGGTAE